MVDQSMPSQTWLCACLGCRRTARTRRSSWCATACRTSPTSGPGDPPCTHPEDLPVTHLTIMCLPDHAGEYSLQFVVAVRGHMAMPGPACCKLACLYIESRSTVAHPVE